VRISKLVQELEDLKARNGDLFVEYGEASATGLTVCEVAVSQPDCTPVVVLD
jgi:hypothetical protein